MARPDCPRCEGTGFVVNDEEQDARLSTAVRCDCTRHEPGSADLEACGLPQRYLHCTLAGYRPRTDRQQMALKVAQGFVDDYPNNDAGLLFTGPCGVGKTHLAAAVLRELVLEQAVGAVFADYQDLLKRIQMTYSRSGGEGLTEEQVLGPVLEAELLVLDDLGARRPTPWAEEVVSHLLSVRYNEERATLITTNLADLESEGTAAGPGGAALAERVSERVMSRLHEMCKFLTLDGADYRRDRSGGR